MSASSDALSKLTAQFYNTTVVGLNLSEKDFQLSQGNLIVPSTTENVWDMMNQVPNNSIAQVYTPSTIETFSSEFRTILSDLTFPNNDDFTTIMGDQFDDWQKAWTQHARLNPSVFNNLDAAEMQYFKGWSSFHMAPGVAAKASNALAQVFDNPVGISQAMVMNLNPGAEAPFTLTQQDVIDELNKGEARSYSMDSSTASSDLNNAWSSSSSSEGGTYFYTKTTSSEASDFTQTFASSSVTVSTQFTHIATVPIIPLGNGTVEEGGSTYLPWYYGAGLIQGYQDPSAETWVDPAKWEQFFGSDGALQYVATALVLADGITQSITSEATFSTAQQTYAHTQSHAGYGCWPFYVNKDSSSTSKTSTSFDDAGKMTSTVSSPVGNPVVIGVLVSPIKDLVTGHSYSARRLAVAC